MADLIVADMTIKQDSEGRYCLNDLHRASGGNPKDRPNYWLQLDHVSQQIAILEKAGNPAISAKRGVGTFVHKKLVYSYAMWISADFHLEVIRAFDQLQTQGFAFSDRAVNQHVCHQCLNKRDTEKTVFCKS